MGVFDDLIKVDKDGNISYSGWIEWQHVARGFMHCLTCLSLHKCWFNRAKMPTIPKHEHCHCSVKAIAKPNLNDIKSECKIEKFTGYIFSDKYADNGKRELFYLMGFNIEDSEYLKKEFERHAQLEFSKSNYELRDLDKYGQRINIKIILRNNNREYKIISGWMVRPNGKLELATPLADD